jgi:hypothetical protein
MAANRGSLSGLVTGPRCFPPPWSAEETDACFIVRDANRQALAYVYCEEEPGPLPYALSSIAIIVQRQAASVYLKHSPPFRIHDDNRCAGVSIIGKSG